MNRKTILILVLMILGMYRFTIAEQGYEISVTINNMKDDVLYLGYPYGDKKYIQDTARAVSGRDFLHCGRRNYAAFLDQALYIYAS